MPSITVPATLNNLQSAQTYLKKNIPEKFKEQTSNVLLVAEELLVNVFSYAYPAGEEGRAKIGLEVETVNGQQMLVFTVKDWGAPFNPFDEAPAPDLTSDVETRPIGGLGIFLIKQVSTAHSYKYANNMNCINIYFAAD